MEVTSMIVGMTSHEDEHSAFMESGVDQCLAKPLTFGKIASLIDQLKSAWSRATVYTLSLSENDSFIKVWLVKKFRVESGIERKNKMRVIFKKTILFSLWYI